MSVFNSVGNPDKFVNATIIRLAVELGGRRLDAFDTYLPHLYALNGFRVDGRTAWDDTKKPGNWDKKYFKGYTSTFTGILGEPDVVFMFYDPDYFGRYVKGEGTKFDTFDLASTSQQKAAAGIRRKLHGKK